nr:hypothetical protein [Hyphomonas sp. 34-62-18]
MAIATAVAIRDKILPALIPLPLPESFQPFNPFRQLVHYRVTLFITEP